MTDANEEWPTGQETDFRYTHYFESPMSKDVEPVSYNWPPGMWNPYQTPQIFSKSMDSSTLDALLDAIPGSNVTTATLRGTSIDNPISDFASQHGK